MTNEVAQPFRLIAALLVAATALALPAPGFAQSSGGAIAGIVADAQGGVLPGVVVTAKNADSGVLRSTVTEPDGRHRVTAFRAQRPTSARTREPTTRLPPCRPTSTGNTASSRSSNATARTDSGLSRSVRL